MVLIYVLILTYEHKQGSFLKYSFTKGNEKFL